MGDPTTPVSAGVNIDFNQVKLPETVQSNGSDLGTNYVPATLNDPSGVETYMNQNQGKLHTFANWVAQASGSAVLGTVESASYLLDFEQHWDKLHGSELEYDNKLAEMMREAKEGIKEATPIYRSKEGQQAFSPGSVSFWTSNTPDVIGTVLGLLIPAAGAAKLAGGAAKLLGAGQAAQSTAALTGSVIASRYAESTMEAGQVFKDEMAALSEKYPNMGSQQKQELAGQAASRTWNTNWLLAVQDAFQYNTLFKGVSRIGPKVVKGADKLYKAEKATKGFSLSDLITQPVSEGAEEGLQNIFAEEAKKSGLNNGEDYFGPGFWSNRLSDYVSSDDFKASVALGAFGGGIFAGAGKLGEIKGRQARLNLEALAKERANYVNDIITSKKIDNKIFSELAFKHLEANDTEGLKETLQEYSKDEDIDASVKTRINEQMEDLDFLRFTHEQIKPIIKKELHQKALADYYDVRQSSRLQQDITSATNNIYQELRKTNELPEELHQLKRLKVTLDALEKFKTNPKYTQTYNQVAQAYATALAQNPEGMSPEYYAASKTGQLLTAKDTELNTLAKQAIQNAVHIADVRDEIAKYATKEGQEQSAKEHKEKEVLQKTEAELAKPQADKSILKKMSAEASTPQVKEKIDAKIKEVETKERVENQDFTTSKINDVVGVEPPQEEFVPEDSNEPEELTEPPEQTEPGELEAPPDLTEPPEFDPDETVIAPEFGATYSELEEAMGKETADEFLERYNIEQAPEPKLQKSPTTQADSNAKQKLQEKGTVPAWSKFYQGEWTVDKDGNEVFKYKIENGKRVPQLYWDNTTGEQVPANKIYATTADGHFYVDTPMVKAGDKVLLEVVDNGKDKQWPFSYTKGFRPQNAKQYVINVYRINEKGEKLDKLPIQQLPSDDNKYSKSSELTALRDRVIYAPGQQFTTYVASKNIGDPRTVKGLKNSPEILEFDFHLTPGNNWSYARTEHNPIFVIGDLNGNIIAPNVGAMKGMNSTINSKIEEVINPDLIEKPNKNATGAVFTLRMNPEGNFKVVQVQPRNLNEADLTWVRDNLSNLLAERDYLTLNQVYHIADHPVGIYSTKAGHKIPDVVNLDKKRFHIVKLTANNTELLIPIKGSKGTYVWAVIPASGTNPQVDNLINNKPFLFTYIDSKGKKHKGYYKSDDPKSSNSATEVVKAFNSVLNNQETSRRNIRKEVLNSEVEYTDPVTKQVYPTFYDFIKSGAMTTDLEGSVTKGHGEDSSYSFANSRIRLVPRPEQNQVVVNKEDNTIIKEIKPTEEPVATTPSETSTKSIEELMEEYGNDEKTRPSTDKGFKALGDKELSWFQRQFGDEFLSIAQGVDRIISKSGKEAFGLYQNALIKLADLGETGTLYHEAFHFVLDPQLGFVTEGERAKILAGTDEETRAEEFRAYMLSDGKIAPKVPKAKTFFKRLWQAIKNLIGLKNPIEKLFDRIASKPLTEDQKAFAKLVQEYGAGDESLRVLPGFYNYRTQQEAVDAAVHKIMKLTRQQADAYNVEIGEIFKTPGNIDKLIEAVRQEYEKDAKQIEEGIVNKSNIERQRYAAYKGMGVVFNPHLETGKQGTWDTTPQDETKDKLEPEPGFKSEIVKGFKKFGFSVSIKGDNIEADYGFPESNDQATPSYTEGEVSELKQEDEAERVHDVDHTLRTPNETLTQRMRYFLSSIPEPGAKPSILGTPKYIDFNRVMSNLKNKLANTRNPITKLEKLAKNDKIAAAVFNELSKQQQEGNEQLIKEFSTRFNLAHHNFKTILIEFAESVKNITAKFIDTDRQSLNKATKSQWRQEAVRKNFIQTDGTVITDKAIYLDKELQAFRTAFYNNKNAKTNIPFDEVKSKFLALAKEVGILPPNEVWLELDQLNPGRKYSTLERWFFGKQTNSLESMIDLALEGKDPYAITSGIADLLASKSKDYVEDVKGDVFMNEFNDLVNPINLPSYLTDFVRDIKDPEQAERLKNKFLQDNFYKDNEFVKLFTDTKVMERLTLDFISASRSGEGSPKDFEGRTAGDSLIARLSAFHNSESELTTSIFIGTFSDKGKQATQGLPRKTGSYAKEFLTRVLKNTMNAEVARIQRIKQNPGFPFPYARGKNNHYLGLNFLYLTDLNKVEGLADSVYNGDTNPERMNKALEEANQIIDKHIVDQYQIFKDYLVDKGVLNKVGDEYKSSKIPNHLLAHRTLESLLQEWFYNDYGWRVEMSKVYNGDLALYSSKDDYYKRGYQGVTPGIITNSQETFTRGIYPKQIKENSKAFFKWFKEVNKTDAQSYVNTATYRRLAKNWGMWKDAHEQLYNFAWSKGQTINQAIKEQGVSREVGDHYRKLAKQTTLEVLKPFQYNDRVITLPDGTKMIAKEQFKDSWMWLNPELTTRHTELKKLSDFMNTNGFDVMSAADTVKVGSYGVVDDFEAYNKDTDSWKKRTVHFDEIRFPQMMPSTKKDKVTGTQFWKLIMGNLPINDSRIEKFNDLWEEKIATSAKELQSKLGMGADYQLSQDPKKRLEQLNKIKVVLQNELGSRQVNDNYEDAIRLVLDQFNQPNFQVDLGFPAYSAKFISILTNLFKKNILQQKSPGFSMVNFADFGVNEVATSSNIGLVKNEDGSIEAEVGLPLSYYKSIGLDFTDKYVDRATHKIKWEELNNEQKDALRFILYRIPTSNKSSMTPCRAVMILPETSGNVVMLPGELTVQQGLDFDVDKSQILKRTLNKENKIDADSVDNKLFDIAWSVLTDPKTVEEVFTPLDFATITTIYDNYAEKGVIKTRSDASTLSIATDVDMEIRNKHGKAMIGIDSRANTAHAVLQIIKEYVKVSPNAAFKSSAKGYEFNELGRTHDEDGTLISKNYGELQQSSLDNAKSPIKALLNIFPVTDPIVLYLTGLGSSLERTFAFINQPVIRRWVELYEREGGTSTTKATNALLEEYPSIAAVIADTKHKALPYSKEQLKNSLGKNIKDDSAKQADVFKEFQKLLSVSGRMTDINNVLSVDTFSDMTGIEPIESFLNQLKDATDPDGPIKVDAVVFDAEKAPKSSRRLASFYKYALDDSLAFNSQFVPYSSQAYRDTTQYLADMLGLNHIENKDTMKELNTFLDYYTLVSSSKLTEALNKVSPDYLKRWSYVQDVRSIWKHIDRLSESNKIVKNNPFIRGIYQVPSKKDSVQMVGVINTSSNIDKAELTRGWYDLLNSSDNEARILAGDLIRFAVTTSGFKFNTRSFFDLIPVDFWVTSGLAKDHKDIIANLSNDLTSIDSHSAIRSFVRHRFQALNEVPEAYYTHSGGNVSTNLLDVLATEGHVHSFSLLETDPIVTSARRISTPRFLKIYDNDAQKYRLYEEHPQIDRSYTEVQPLGEDRAFLEVAGNLTAIEKSVLPNNQDAREADPYSDLKYDKDILPMFTNAKVGENVFVARYIPGGKTDAKTSLELLLENEPNTEHKATIEILLRNIDKINTPIISTGKLDSKTAGQFRIISTDGKMESTEILINNKVELSDGEVRNTILHEFIHAYTIGILEHPLTDLENSFALNINRLLRDARAKATDEQLKLNGLVNKHEFVAEIASSKEFRDFLRSQDSTWKRWIRNVRRLFGFKDQFDQVLEDLYGVIDAGTDLQAPASGDYVHNKPLEREKIKGKKRLTALEQVHSLVKSRIKKLKAQGRDIDSKQLESKYEAIQENEEHEQIIAYMIQAHNEVEELKELWTTLSKDPAKINPDIIQPIQDQLASYRLINSFNNQIHRDPDKFIPKGANPEVFKKYIAELITDINRLTESINRLGLMAFAKFVKDSSNDPNLTFDKVVEDLEFAERDVTWLSRWQDVGKEIRDTAIGTLHRTIAKIKGASWRSINNDLHKKDSTKETTVVEMLVPNSNNEGYHYERRNLSFTKTGYFKALKDYEKWVGNKSTFSDKFAPIIDQASLAENDNGIQFISPWSKRGKEILAIKEGSSDYPLRQFYETFVLGYLKSQENIPARSMRPGLRVPSLGKSLMETVFGSKSIKEGLTSMTNIALDEVRRRYDETDYYGQDENGERLNYIPTRFVAKQDGQEGRFNTRQISLDIATTIPLFVHEMYSRKGMEKVVSVLELGKTVLASRRVMKDPKLVSYPGIASLLTAEREGNTLEGGGLESISGVESNAYKAYETGLRQHVYGQLKKEEGAFNIGKNKFSLSKMADAFLKYSGFNMMFGNIAIPLTNKLVGELGTIKEGIGGNLVSPKDLIYGKALFYKEAFASLADFAQREKKTKMGRVFSFFNPYEHEFIGNLGTNTNYAKEIFSKIIRTSGSTIEYQIGVQAMGAVMNRFKAKDKDDKSVPLYEALDIDSTGKVVLGKDYTYNDKKSITDAEIQQVKDYTLRLYQNIYGVANSLDKSASNEFIVGRLVNFLRNWLTPGINTRWRTKKYDEAFGTTQEGHYVSALIAFNNIFTQEGFAPKLVDSIRILSWYGVNKPTLLLHPNELELPEEEQKELIALRKANIKKTLFELYGLVALTALLAVGWDDDEESYAKLLTARMRKELGTFLSPTQLWDVLKSPTAALNTVDGLNKIIYDVQNSLGAMVISGDQPIYQRGPGQGENKLWFDIKRQTGLGSLSQFEDLSSKIRVVKEGYR